MKERDVSLSVKTLFNQLECKRNVWSVVNDGGTRLACTPSFKGHLIVACRVAHYLWQPIWSINKLSRAMRCQRTGPFVDELWPQCWSWHVHILLY